MSERAVSLRNCGQGIAGTLHLPAGRGRCPAVLLLHGFTGHRIEAHFLFVKTSRALARAGIASLRFDFRGSGESEGDFRDVTIAGELSDAEKAWRFLRKQPRVAAKAMGLLGFSMGGAVAAMLAGRESSVRSLVLWSAVADPAKLVGAVITDEQRSALASRGDFNHNGHRVGRKFVESLPKAGPMQDLSRSRAPLLLVHGEEDPTVPVASSHAFHAASMARPDAPTSELLIVPGADHTYAHAELEDRVIERTVSWFRATLPLGRG